MAGLQGAGKTTTTAKIAGKLKAKGRNPLLVACDIYRPAAIEQLQNKRRKAGCSRICDGNEPQAGEYRKGSAGARGEERQQCGYPRYSRPSSH
ncbi:MAG: hypothetical protein ACLR8P_08605 [Clostridium fessum]